MQGEIYVDNQRIRIVNKLDKNAFCTPTHFTGWIDIGLEVFLHPWKHIIGNYFSDWAAWAFTTFHVKSKFFCGNGMLKEKTLDAILCNDSHAIQPFSNPSDLYCAILRWQFYSFRNLLASQRKCFKSSYSHEKNRRIYLVNQCVCLLQKDVVGWDFPGLPWIGKSLEDIYQSIDYICKLLSGFKILLVQICLVSTGIVPEAELTKKSWPAWSNMRRAKLVPKMSSKSWTRKGQFTYYDSQNWGFVDPPSPPRQPSSSFARRPFCTTIFYIDFLTWQNGGYSFTWVQLAYYMTLHNVHG